MSIIIHNPKAAGKLYGLSVYTSPSIGEDKIWLGYIKEDDRIFYGLFAMNVETVKRLEGDKFEQADELE